MPILRRDLLGILRSRRGYWIALLTVLATGILPIYSWPDEGNPMPSQAAIAGFDQYRQVFFLALFLFVPAVAGSAITAEREAGTYEVLASSISHSSSIAAGKLLASTLFFELLLVLTFPMVLKLFLLGGFEIGDYVSFLFSLSIFVLLEGIIGLIASFRSLSTTRALILSYVFCFPLYLLSRAGDVTFLTAIVFLAMGLLFLRRTARNLEPPRRRLTWDEIRFTKNGFERLPPPRTAVTEEILVSARDGIPDRWNPVFLAAVRGEAFGNIRFRSAMFWGPGVAILLASIAGIDDALRGGPSLLIGIILCPYLIFFPAAGALALIVERQPGRLDLLRSTPLTPGEVIRGKLYAVLFGGLSFALWDLLVIGLFWIAIIDRFNHPHIDPALMETALLMTFVIYPSIGFVAVLAASMGLFAAALLRKTVPALILAYALDLAPILGIGYLFSQPWVDLGVIVFFIVWTFPAGWALLHICAVSFERLWLRE